MDANASPARAAYEHAMAEAAAAYIASAHAAARGCGESAIRSYAGQAAWLLENRPEGYARRLSLLLSGVMEIVSIYRVPAPALSLPPVTAGLLAAN